MAENSKIEWTNHTFNPWIGCQHVGPGCDHCYAETMTPARVLRARGIETWGVHATRHRTSAANWRQPLVWNGNSRRKFEAWENMKTVYSGLTDAQLISMGFIQPTRPRVFCASLADVFDSAVPDGWRRDLFDLIDATPHLDWLLLTKRIGNASRMIAEASATVEFKNDSIEPWTSMKPWENVWIGITVCNQEEADRDIPKLLDVPARVRFLSMEPLLGPVDLTPAFLLCPNSADGISMDPETGAYECCRQCDYTGISSEIGIDWIIVGGESGPKARPMHPNWVRSLRDQCAAAGVPFMMKQWGEWVPRSACYHTFADGKSCADYDPVNTKWPCIRMTEAGHDGHDLSHAGEGDDAYLQRVGKVFAGRLLNGVQHDGYPEART